MNTGLKCALLSALQILSLCVISVSPVDARTFNADCANLPGGLSLQELLDRGMPGDTLNLTGTCNERIIINVQNVTINGGGSAVIEGAGLTDNSRGLVYVRSSDVRIIGLTVQNSPDTGSVAGGITVDGAQRVHIEGSTVTQSAGHGINVINGGTATISNNTIIANAGSGVEALSGSFVNLANNTITNSGECGISVVRTSSALLRGGNDVVDSVEDLVCVGKGSSFKSGGAPFTGVNDKFTDDTTGLAIIWLQESSNVDLSNSEILCNAPCTKAIEVRVVSSVRAQHSVAISGNIRADYASGVRVRDPATLNGTLICLNGSFAYSSDVTCGQTCSGPVPANCAGP